MTAGIFGIHLPSAIVHACRAVQVVVLNYGGIAEWILRPVTPTTGIILIASYIAARIVNGSKETSRFRDSIIGFVVVIMRYVPFSIGYL